jgi:hypothetical protein
MSYSFWNMEIEGLMKAIGFNKHECIRNLRLYRDKMEKILSLIEDKLPLRGANKEKVQLLLKVLKQSLKIDLDRCSTGRGQKQMSSVEQDFYMPAIHEAEKRISVEINSTPSQRWIDEIDIAQKYIKYYLNQLLS